MNFEEKDLLKLNVLKKILWASIEEAVGLWEIHWEINSLFPVNTMIENQTIAHEALIYLIDNELITPCFYIWGTNELTNIENDQVNSILKDGKWWLPPDINTRCLKFEATEKGEVYYNKL